MYKKLLLFLGGFLILSGCFNYEEKILIYGNWSGKVFIKYDVPVFQNSGKSIIAFLPTEKEKWEKKLNLKISKFEINPQKSLLSNFDYKEIKLEFEFDNPEILENKLLGLKKVMRQRGGYLFKREFLALKIKVLDNQIYSYIYNYIYSRFKDFILKFEIEAPIHFDLLTNLGNLPAPGKIFYFFPLSYSLDGDKKIQWDVFIKANPTP